jgi:hypothetical protein
MLHRGRAIRIDFKPGCYLAGDEAMFAPWKKCGNGKLAGDATARSHDLFCPADLGVIAADNPFDLAGRTATVVYEQDLAFPHRSQRRFLLHGFGKCRTENADYQKSKNEACRPDHFPLLQFWPTISPRTCALTHLVGFNAYQSV